MSVDESDQAAPAADRVVAIIEGSEVDSEIVRLGHRLAESFKVAWEAIVPVTASGQSDASLAGEALALAARLGAMVARVPAATATAAVSSHIESCARPHVVLAISPRGSIARAISPSLAEALAERFPRLVVHGVALPRGPAFKHEPDNPAPARSYLMAAVVTLVTLAIVFLLQRITGTNYLSVLFLLPVIAAAARLGVRPALLAAVLSAAGFNVFFLAPVRVFDPFAIQTWLMLGGLGGVAIYTAWVTGTLRNRLLLSDRSAQESAALAAFAQELTRVSNWAATAQVVCREIANLLAVRTIVVREVSGSLQVAGAFPEGAMLDPLDQAALDWAWSRAEPAGSGTANLAEASWQFQPLATSLGVLAVLGMARDDGRNPVAADRQVLLGTMIAQAALAHERLRLEDKARRATARSIEPNAEA